MFHEHVDHAMLQHLELADGHTKLLTLTGIIHCHGVSHLHGATRFCTDCRNGLIGHRLNQWQSVVDFADHGFRTNGDIFEVNFGCPAAIHGRIVACADALGVLRNHEYCNAVAVTTVAGRTRRYDEVGGPRRTDNDSLVPV